MLRPQSNGEFNHSRALGRAWIGLGFGYSLLRDLETARRHIEKGLKIQSDSGVEAILSMHYWFSTVVHFDSADLKNAQRCSEKGLELSQKNNEKYIEGLSRISLEEYWERGIHHEWIRRKNMFCKESRC